MLVALALESSPPEVIVAAPVIVPTPVVGSSPVSKPVPELPVPVSVEPESVGLPLVPLVPAVPLGSQTPP